MIKFLKLVKVNLISLLVQSNFSNSLKRKKTNSSKSGFTIAFILMLGLLFCFLSGFYSYWMISALEPFGTAWLALAAFYLVTVILTLITGIYTTSSFLFSSKDMENLFSYPLRQWQILLSKVFSILIENWAFGLVLIIPASAVYWVIVKPSPMFIVYTILGFLFISLIPVAVSTVISYLINLFTSGSRIKTLLNIIFTLAFIVLMSALPSVLLHNFDFLKLLDISFFIKVYPPIYFLFNAIVNQSFIDSIWFVLINLILFSGFILALSSGYRALWSKATASRLTASKPIKTAETSSKFSALLKKEFSKYLSSAMYVLNSSIGALMILVFAIYTCFFPDDALSEIINIPGISSLIVPGVLIIFGFIAAMTCTTSSSISLEGKTLWIVKTLPVDAISILKAKLAVNFIIGLPAILVSAAIVSFSMNLWETGAVWIFLLPAELLIIVSLFGLIINLYHHRFDFQNDMQVVKNSASVIITLFSSWGLLIALSAGYILLRHQIDFNVYAAVTALLLACVIVFAYRFIKKKGQLLFDRL